MKYLEIEITFNDKEINNNTLDKTISKLTDEGWVVVGNSLRKLKNDPVRQTFYLKRTIN